MKFTVYSQDPFSSNHDAVILFTYEEGSVAEERFASSLGKNIVVARQRKEFEGKPKQLFVEKQPGTPRFFALAGLGKRKDFSVEILKNAASAAAVALRNIGAKQLGIEAPSDVASDIACRAIVEGTGLGAYQFNAYKTQKLDEIKELSSIAVLVEKEQLVDAKRGLEESMAIVDACTLVRDLQNTPSSDMTPKILAEQAYKLTKDGLRVGVIEKSQLAKQGYNGILSVGRGSASEPRLVTIEHKPKKSAATIAIVGKGITFDSGGISIKPSAKMADMKYDMSGAAAVIGIMQVVAKLNIPIRVIGILCLAENMPDGGSYKPGDIVRTKSGKTIEIDNTDAEGRVVLSDGLYHATTFAPNVIIDLATLTGAAVVALGDNAAAVLGTEQKLIDSLILAGKATGERLWQLPLWDEYAEDIKSSVADMKNVGVPGSAGTIAGAMLLKEFVGDTPWAHLDIAGVAYTQGRERFLTSNGGTAFGVRLVVEYLKTYK